MDFAAKLPDMPDSGAKKKRLIFLSLIKQSVSLGFLTPPFHPKTSTFRSKFFSHEEKSPTFLSPIKTREKRFVTHEMKTVTHVMESITHVMDFISCVMKFISCVMKFISCEMKSISCVMKFISCEMKFISCVMKFISHEMKSITCVIDSITCVTGFIFHSHILGFPLPKRGSYTYN
jgi:hypothetical protein